MSSDATITRAALTHVIQTAGDPDGQLHEIGQLLELDMELSPADRATLSNVLTQAAEGRCLPSTLVSQLHGIAGRLGGS